MIKTLAVKNIYTCTPLSSSGRYCLAPPRALDMDMLLPRRSHTDFLKGKDSTRIEARLPESSLAPKSRLGFLSESRRFCTLNTKPRGWTNRGSTPRPLSLQQRLSASRGKPGPEQISATEVCQHLHRSHLTVLHYIFRSPVMLQLYTTRRHDTCFIAGDAGHTHARTQTHTHTQTLTESHRLSAATMALLRKWSSHSVLVLGIDRLREGGSYINIDLGVKRSRRPHTPMWHSAVESIRTYL